MNVNVNVKWHAQEMELNSNKHPDTDVCISCHRCHHQAVVGAIAVVADVSSSNSEYETHMFLIHFIWYTVIPFHSSPSHFYMISKRKERKTRRDHILHHHIPLWFLSVDRFSLCSSWVYMFPSFLKFRFIEFFLQIFFSSFLCQSNEKWFLFL